MQLPSKIFSALRVLMWGTAAFLLSLPALAMKFFPDADVDWDGRDFLIMGVLLAIACGLVEVGIRMARNNFAYFAGVVFAVGTGFVTIWVNLAVGMILSESNLENLVFLGVIATALAGAILVRFAPRGMAVSTAAAGALQAVIALVVGLAGLDNAYTAMLIGAFALPWLLSAACFHMAEGDRAFADGLGHSAT